MSKLEKERKFVVASITSWSVLADLLKDVVDIKRINQTYLKPKPNEQAARVRQTISGLSGHTKTEYHYNKKKPIETGVHQETEFKISEKEYHQYLKQANPNKCEVEKN